ncbi:MAG: universal stress protein [Halobacteriota archaeon]|uniref:universal stress protein n=1 Tax=Natronomonas sp. TaxID=2184060 RepID=UPI0039763D7B
MYERILLPTDGSRGNSRAVKQAIGLAAETDAELHVLFVVEDIPYAPEMMDGEVEARLRQIGEDAIEDIRERADDAGVEIETAIEDGTPHRAILEYADDEGADLIVMGTHGRSGLDRYLLGSVTERVVRGAEIPVLTVRVSDEPNV